jgi:hypothetical protein
MMQVGPLESTNQQAHRIDISKTDQTFRGQRDPTPPKKKEHRAWALTEINLLSSFVKRRCCFFFFWLWFGP